MRSIFLAAILAAVICVLTSCNKNSPANNTTVSQSTQPQSSSEVSTITSSSTSTSTNTSSSSDGLRKIAKPSELIGKPDKIIVMKGGKETVFEPKSKEYTEIIKKLEVRFPEKLKGAQLLIEWRDKNNNLDWQLMAKEFDYLRLAYNDAQNIKIECTSNDNYKPEASFKDLVFPLSDWHTQLCIVGTKMSFGILDRTDETLAELLKYGDGSEASTSSSSDGMRRITKTIELIGKPDKIIVMKGGKETVFEPKSKEYAEIIKKLDVRFPQIFKETGIQIAWRDENKNLDWQLMAKDFDYLRLSFNNVQNVEIECKGGGGEGNYSREASFQDLVFPLSGELTQLCIVGTKRSFGILDHTDETLAELLKYSDGSEVSTSSSSDGMRRITKTIELIGKPDKIIVMKGGKETVFEPKSKEYAEIIKKLELLFPAEFKGAQMAIEWRDKNNNLDWQLMAKEFDYLRLAYNDVQNIKIECTSDANYKPEASFKDIIFPLSGRHTQLCIVGTKMSFGVLRHTTDSLSELLKYSSQ